MKQILVFCLCLLVLSCNQKVENDGQLGVEKPVEVLGVVLNMDNTFMQQLAAGWALPVDINGQEFKFTLHTEDPQGSIDREIEITETYMRQGIHAWVGYPINSEAMAPLADEMKKKGIYILTEGNHVPGQTMGMVTDERDGGLLGGRMFVDWWNENRPNEKPYILVLDFPVAEAAQRKPDAFVEYVKQNMPEAVIVGQQNANADVETAMNVVSNFILSNPELNFVFCINDSNAVGALAAVESSGRKDIAVVGCGGEDNVLPYLFHPLTEQKGGLAFEVAYEKSSIEFGHAMMIGLGQLFLDPDNVDYNIIDIGFTALTRDNVQEYVDRKNEWLKRIGDRPLEL
jgi:ribose transport system substrate-binding protein